MSEQKIRDGRGWFLDGNPGVVSEVPVEPLREAFLRSGLSASELARRLGWTRPDSMRVNRQLGLIATRSGHGAVQFRETMSYDRAEAIRDALGVDPTEVEL